MRRERGGGGTTPRRGRPVPTWVGRPGERAWRGHVPHDADGGPAKPRNAFGRDGAEPRAGLKRRPRRGSPTPPCTWRSRCRRRVPIPPVPVLPKTTDTRRDEAVHRGAEDGRRGGVPGFGRAVRPTGRRAARGSAASGFAEARWVRRRHGRPRGPCRLATGAARPLRRKRPPGRPRSKGTGPSPGHVRRQEPALT